MLLGVVFSLVSPVLPHCISIYCTSSLPTRMSRPWNLAAASLACFYIFFSLAALWSRWWGDDASPHKVPVAVVHKCNWKCFSFEFPPNLSTLHLDSRRKSRHQTCLFNVVEDVHISAINPDPLILVFRFLFSRRDRAAKKMIARHLVTIFVGNVKVNMMAGDDSGHPKIYLSNCHHDCFASLVMRKVTMRHWEGRCTLWLQMSATLRRWCAIL